MIAEGILPFRINTGDIKIIDSIENYELTLGNFHMFLDNRPRKDRR